MSIFSVTAISLGFFVGSLNGRRPNHSSPSIFGLASIGSGLMSIPIGLIIAVLADTKAGYHAGAEKTYKRAIQDQAN